jgi:hypothetical protein
MTQLSPHQRDALRLGSGIRWLGTREIGVTGSTMVSLQRRRLADVRYESDRMVFRLTPAGIDKRDEIAADTARRLEQL